MQEISPNVNAIFFCIYWFFPLSIIIKEPLVKSLNSHFQAVSLLGHGVGHIYADIALLRRALGNLIANALSHTPRGGQVVITGSKSPDYVVISVGDMGEGIPPEDIFHVFDRFYRSDSARSKGVSALA